MQARFSPSFFLWLGYLVFTVYGSLVPLDYRPIPLDQAWSIFQQTPMLKLGVESRADWIANGVLYVPIGFLTAHLLIERLGARQAVPLLLLAGGFCGSLAIGVEFTQIFFPPRTVSLNDLIAEGVGSAIGLLLAGKYSEWFRALLRGFFGKPERLLLHLTEAYLFCYLAFSLFPYDVLISAAEIVGKLRDGNWGWLLAPDEKGRLFALMKLASEVLLTLPFGLYLGYRTKDTLTASLPHRQPKPGSSTGLDSGPPRNDEPESNLRLPKRHPLTLAQAILLGTLLGGFVEIAQFFIASGVSQGLSVATRVAGVCGGFILWRNRTHFSPDRLETFIRSHALWLAAMYLPLLLLANGWFSHAWHGLDSARLQWNQLHFLPFHYHYYTTETNALLSLASVCLMYLPIGLLTWANRASPALAFFLAFAIAGFVETGKLFLNGIHPDPTNLIIAALASCGGVHFANTLVKGITIASMPETAAARFEPAVRGHGIPQTGTDLPANERPAAHWTTAALAWPAIAFAAYEAATFPTQPGLLCLFLAACGAILWRWPPLLIAVLPASLPLLGLAPWSGRFFLDEFDLLLAIGISVAYIRMPADAARGRHPDPLFLLAATLLTISFAVSTVRGMLPWHALDANAFTNYHSPFNALRVAKGALWAFLLYGLMTRFVSARINCARLFALGMATGAAGTTLVIIWERLTFPGLLNFADVYRVTGPFWQMHVGEADIETYLTVSAPFLVMLLFEQRHYLARMAYGFLLLATSYAVMVTFSRAGYAGYGIAVILSIVFSTRRTSCDDPTSPGRRLIAGGIVCLAVIGVSAPVFFGQFAQERMAGVGADLNMRYTHWRNSLEMRDPNLLTSALGMGLGRYPQTHYWRSNENRASSYSFGMEGKNAFLRLGTGDAMYFDQFVAVQPDNDYSIQVNARSDTPSSRITLTICEKWLLTSARCVMQPMGFDGNGKWQTLRGRISTGDVGRSGGFLTSRPVKFSFFNASQTAKVDVTNIRLINDSGENLLKNGDFSKKLDHWFFSVDNYWPWHIASLPMQVLFDQGWLGISAFVLFVLPAFWRAGKNAWRGNAAAGGFVAAATGFAAIGTLDSLVDSPRLLLLFLALIWASWNSSRLTNPSRTRSYECPLETKRFSHDHK